MHVCTVIHVHTTCTCIEKYTLDTYMMYTCFDSGIMQLTIKLAYRNIYTLLFFLAVSQQGYNVRYLIS